MKARAKSLRSKKRLSFITIHCAESRPLSHRSSTNVDPDLYMIGMTIVGSILLYPGGGIAYIDALFFAAGACTQSGLNTYDHSLLCSTSG